MIRKIVVREGSYAFHTPLHETNSNWVLHSNVHREDCNDDGYGDLFWIGCPALQSEWQVTVRTRFLFLFFSPDTVIPITLASSSNRNIIATHILTLFFLFWTDLLLEVIIAEHQTIVHGMLSIKLSHKLMKNTSLKVHPFLGQTILIEWSLDLNFFSLYSHHVCHELDEK